MKFEFRFHPLTFYKVIALELRKILWIISFLHFCSPLRTLQSQILTNQNWICYALTIFDWIIPLVEDLVLIAIHSECLLYLIYAFLEMVENWYSIFGFSDDYNRLRESGTTSVADYINASVIEVRTAHIQVYKSNQTVRVNVTNVYLIFVFNRVYIAIIRTIL
jgi:hypothetical protein